jgi:predicted LPLAT superfamily acyltransferase
VLFYPSIRRRCAFYLRRRFPEHGALRRWRDTFRLVKSYSTTLVDMFVMETLGPGVISASCPNHDELIERCGREAGFVLVHAHLGCFQIGVSALKQFPKPVSIVMIPEPKFRMPAGVIDPRRGLEGVMLMTDAVLRGEIVTMMGDRSFGSDHNVAPVKFLGGTALFPVTPYRLASATGSAIVVMTAPRVAKSAYELRVEKVIEVPRGLGRNAEDYAPYAQQFADCVERFAMEFPWQVFNFYDMWAAVNSESRNQNGESNPKSE